MSAPQQPHIHFAPLPGAAGSGGYFLECDGCRDLFPAGHSWWYIYTFCLCDECYQALTVGRITLGDLDAGVESDPPTNDLPEDSDRDQDPDYDPEEDMIIID